MDPIIPTPSTTGEWIIWLVLMVIIPLSGYIGARLNQYFEFTAKRLESKIQHDFALEDEIRKVMVEFIREQIKQYQQVANSLESQQNNIEEILEKVNRIELLIEIITSNHLQQEEEQ